MAAEYPALLAYDLNSRITELLAQGTPLPALVSNPRKLGFDYSQRTDELVAAGFGPDEASRLSRRFPPFMKMEIGVTFDQLTGIGLRPAEVRRLVSETPTLLGLGGISARLRELAAAGFGTADIKAIVLRSPLLLGSNISRHVDDLLDAGFELDDVRSLSRRVPGFLGSRCPEQLAELDVAGFPRSDCVQMLVKRPSLLAYDLVPRLSALTAEGFTPSAVVRMARQRANLFSYNVSGTLHDLQVHGGLEPDAARELVGMFPASIGYNIRSRLRLLRESAIYVDENGDLDVPKLAWALRRCPQILGYDVGARLSALETSGFSREDALRLVQTNPKVIRFIASSRAIMAITPTQIVQMLTRDM